MLESFFVSRARIRALRETPGGAMLEGFAQDLLQKGYAVISARPHIRAAEHVLHWAHRRSSSTASLNVQTFDNFERHLKRCHCSDFDQYHLSRTRCGARAFGEYLQRAGVVPAGTKERTVREPPLWATFHRWMREQRGTSNATLCTYRIPILELLKSLGEDPHQFEATNLRAFVMKARQRRAPGHTKIYIAALRMFLRFLIAEGKCATGLDAAIPAVANWRFTNLPRYLQPEEVERVIAACDGNSPLELRNRAIVLLLARLGLRAGDIVNLRLSDIDWQESFIRLYGKGRRQIRLPLSQEVGEAVIDYLQAGRSAIDTDALFVHCRAPFGALTDSGAISYIVREAIRRAGVKPRSRGAAHLLRHSLATSMLRQGASLQEISVVLRHRSLYATQIYAKVDANVLRQIAQRWPESQSC